MVAVPRIEPNESVWREQCRRMDAEAVKAMAGGNFGEPVSLHTGRSREELRELYITELERREEQKKTAEQVRAEQVVAAQYLAFGLILGLGKRDRKRERPICPRTTMKHIMQQVCMKHGISRLELISKRRTKHIITARKEFYYRATMETPASFPQIGQMVGGRDHTTILHGARSYAIEHGLPRHDRTSAVLPIHRRAL